MPHHSDQPDDDEPERNESGRPSTALLIGLGLGLWIAVALAAYLLARAVG